MSTDKNKILNEIVSAFSLSDEAARTACLLLEARARTLDYSFEEYIDRYHPQGIAERDENLPQQFKGYVEFLGNDATAILRAGKGANFSDFVHECAHVFRRQLAGELQEQAEKAFGVTNNEWSREKEELFAKGLEQWIKRRHGKDKTRAGIYNKGKKFVDTVYRGMEHIVEINKNMEDVYERLFEDNKYVFKQIEFNETIWQAAEGTLPKNTHLFLGMTPRIYEEIGFQRLPMMITNKHLYTTLRAAGILNDYNYHDLGEDALRQLPEQLKKPLMIVQSPKNETDIISIISLKDKKGDTVIVPIAQYQKGTVNGTEIDINLVKSFYGRTGFEKWLEEAIEDKRLLYMDKKRTEPALDGKLTHAFQSRSTLPPDLKPTVVLQDIFGFLPENVAQYREAVKRKFPERFIQGERILYQKAEAPSQLALDFAESAPPPAIPHPNTPDNFARNYTAMADLFKNDPVEAARFILRAMAKEDREASLAEMRNAGCTDPESYHKYLLSMLAKDSLETGTDYAEKGIGLKSLKQEIERQREERNSVLSAATKEYMSLLETLNAEQLDIWDLESAKDGLRAAKGASLTQIKHQYDYSGGVEIGSNILHRDDIPDRVSPADIKQILVFNAEHIVDAITKKIEEHIKQKEKQIDLVFENEMRLDTLEPDLNAAREASRKGIQGPMAEALLKHTEELKIENGFHPFGAWTNSNQRLSISERQKYNNEAIKIIQRNDGLLTKTDKETLRRYSGFGGIAADGERGVLYDYYTSPPVARLAWKLLEKSGGIADGAKILEPSCGSGVFFETAPVDKAPVFIGVELDERTAQVAEKIHGDRPVAIKNMSFEAFNLSGHLGTFDHIIGNAPFGERTAALAAIDMPEEKSLDNYFVTRSIDSLKENGTMALIAASGVLENKSNEDFRLSLNKKAQFIGALKLPNRSFHHSHTQVTPDILLFKKYPEDIRNRLEALDDETFKTTALYDENFVSGKYFESRPEHIAGELSKGTGQWGNDEVKGDITPENLNAIIDAFMPEAPIPEEIYGQIRELYKAQAAEEKKQLPLSDEELKFLEAKTLRHGAIKITNKNHVYILSDEHTYLLVSKHETLAKKIKDILAISQTVHLIQEGMKNETAQNTVFKDQLTCKSQLAAYKRNYGALPTDDPEIKKFTREYPAVQGIYEAFLTPDDPLIVSDNVYRKKIDIVDGHNAAVKILLTLREKMKDGTEENIRSLFPDIRFAREDIIQEMRTHSDIFITTDGQYQLREDFISGNAWEKIDALKAAAEQETVDWKKDKLLYGAAELEKAVGWTPIEDADFSPRSSWIPQEIVREWASSDEALNHKELQLLSKNDEGKWGISHYAGQWQEKADPLVYYLNGQKQRSNLYDTEGYNREHDDLFRSFISNHEIYRTRLESEYNHKFKTHIVAPVKTYPVEIAGWRNAEQGGKTLKPHQWQSIHHLYRQGCGISALGTGFGKTATGIGLMALLRQEGKSKRVFLQVPNNKVKDWIEEIHDVMPSLKIASIDPEEPGYSNRDKRYAKYQAMARSDADIILMPKSSASEIQLSPENDAKITQKVAHLYKLEKKEGTSRQQESAALRGEYKAKSGKTNVTVCFEDFGCDTLIVDEAHNYKNLFSSTLSRETGLNDGRQSAQAMSLFKKSEYIREQNSQKGVFSLTATPLTNSPLEYYNMLQPVAPQELERMGIATIDGFIREFANIELGWIYDWGSGQAKQGRILTGFKNLPTLQNLFFAYTDLQNNPEAIGLDKPLSKNHPHIIPSDEKQVKMIKAISAELDHYKLLKKEERQAEFPGQNFLTFYSEMRTASLDLELYDPKKYKSWKNTKLQTLANNAYTTYQENKAGQVIFCDRVFSSDASFNIHDKIKQELISQGFKEKDIVIVNGFTKTGGNMSDGAIEKEVSKAIADYNVGKYKVIIGSTACIGEGVNLQKNSSAVHHFDIPFRPSDFIQRNGRVDRQGNEQDKVGLHTYLSSGTIDNYSVNLVQRKANWIDQMLRTKSDVFTNPNDENSIDADELLLALTEEFGDKNDVLKRREELERQKEAKIKEAQTAQMKANLKNLSLARGALQQLEGRENTKDYKKRLEQITSLENSLKNNPLFEKKELLENREPFLFDGGNNKVYRIGDVIVTSHSTFLIENFNFKKQEIYCKAIESDKERSERFDRYKMVKGETSVDKYQNIKISELSENERRYTHNAVKFHFEKVSAEDVEVIRSAASEKFYSLPEGTKEKWYDLHLAIISNRYSNSNFNPAVFSIAKDGSLEIEQGRYRHSDDNNVINPFSPEGKKTIIHMAENSIEYPDYMIDRLIETIGETFPDIKDPVEQAIQKIEAQKKEAALKKELVKQAAVKTNADADHIKKHVSVVGFRR